nr:hypothetical protein [Burkholderia lata]
MTGRPGVARPAAPVRADAAARHYVLRIEGCGQPARVRTGDRVPSAIAALIDALRETARSAVRELGLVLAT